MSRLRSNTSHRDRILNKFSVLDEIALLEKTPTSRTTGTKAAENSEDPFWEASGTSITSTRNIYPKIFE